ncbi:type II toxin-antitoxin system PemK/MazF family toxin [Brevundimonas sp. VNH65]|uniref:type II toxin-antitoxin system PemK/MazF family toxin n=1 Tax=Brevundimonas sp. VNH65 TaxID=3400917 RepID=UPI003C09D229
MLLPDPVPGLVISYAYLWRDEALRGQEEGRKDRPCVVVLAVEEANGRKVVTVAPVTHTPPAHPQSAIEIPAATKQRLGLDGERSWVVAADLNRFVWPGVDLRPVRQGAKTYAYGLLPAAFYIQLRDRIVALAKAGRSDITRRTE